MIQSKNLKLKLGLCGLALTSFLALNSRSVVHADTVQNNNANQNAITWDSDQDDSQVVKEDSEQDNASQSVQKQATIQFSQPAQVQNKAVQPAQKQATVQSNLQNRQSQPKVAISNVSSSSAVQNRAERSAVKISSVNTRTVNQVRINNARPQAKVANVNATVKDAPVQITNPQNNQVIVHYVTSNGQSAGLADQTIDVTKVGKGQYVVPNGYVLANNGYTNSTAEIKQANVTAGTNNVKLNQVTAEKLANMIAPKINDVPVRVNLDILYAGGDGNEGGDGHPAIGMYVTVYKHMKNLQDVGYTFRSDVPTLYQEWGSTPFTTDNIQETETSADEYIQHVNPIYNAVSNLQSEIASGDGTYSKLTEDDCVNILNWLQASFGGDWIPEATPSLYKEIKMSNTTSAPVFTDNSGQVKSVVGNHVNVVVTKPQNVDPNSSDCKRQAQRVIHVTFPNGVKPKSYDSITDSAGNKLTLDSNNDLTQTVTFTRSMTVDSLTGTTLTQTPWQQQGAINAVTLPDIPGYTMVTTN